MHAGDKVYALHLEIRARSKAKNIEVVEYLACRNIIICFFSLHRGFVCELMRKYFAKIRHGMRRETERKDKNASAVCCVCVSVRIGFESTADLFSSVVVIVFIKMHTIRLLLCSITFLFVAIKHFHNRTHKFSF